MLHDPPMSRVNKKKVNGTCNFAKSKNLSTPGDIQFSSGGAAQISFVCVAKAIRVASRTYIT